MRHDKYSRARTLENIEKYPPTPAPMTSLEFIAGRNKMLFEQIDAILEAEAKEAAQAQGTNSPEKE